MECEDYFDAKWEIPTENLVLGDVLGEGAFGVVRKGTLQLGEKRKAVGVKMLKGISQTSCCVQNLVKPTAFDADALSNAFKRSNWKRILISNRKYS